MVASLLALAVATAPGCATKKFVRTEVGNVNAKVDTLTQTVEKVQQRVGENEARIGTVDQKAEAAGKSAADARGAASQAQGAADAAAANARAVGTRVDTVAADVAAGRKLIYQVTLSEDQGQFTFGKADLPDTVKMRLDQVVSALKTDPKNVFIEIQGHTDNVGSAAYNERLGLERAEAAKQYLHEQFQVPLHKMNVFSYGEEKPVASNRTRDGRAQNRRIVIRVLS